MKKGAAAKPVEVEHVEVVPEVPQFGNGRFEYKDNTVYVGNWKILKGVKVKHGHGKITFPGA